MEVELVDVHSLMKDLGGGGALFALEVKVVRVHVEESMKLEGYEHRINADKWRPMIMMFQDLYGLKDEKAVVSKLAMINEETYRM